MQPTGQSQAQEFLTPVGRLVSGNLYTPREKDKDGNLLVIKNGPKKGQPRVEYYFALAIKKTGEQSWAQTAWGQPIYNKAVQSWPQGQTQRADFAWKISDGDSTIPNKNSNKPCDNEGWPGHWILHFSSSFAPKICDSTGANPITEKDAVKLGYFVQVYGSVASNESTQTAGIYLNHMAVSLQAYGTEIIAKSSVDTTKVGFGQGVQLPPGASVQPVAAALPMQPGGMLPGGMPMPGAAPAFAQLPGMIPAPGMAAPQSVVMQPMAAPPQVAVMPNPMLTQLPGMMPAPGMAAPQPVVAPNNNARLTPKAHGHSYEQLLAAGWNDQTLVAQGLMI